MMKATTCSSLPAPQPARPSPPDPPRPLTTGYMGGHWAPELKYAGWDGILLTGRAEKPVALVISDRKVKLVDAAAQWGMDTQETQAALAETNGRTVTTMCIGPAGGDRGRLGAI